MDLGKAFSYPFEDSQWVTSILICGVLLFVPIIGWLMIAGYALEAARNVANGNPNPLPKWDNFMEKLSLGFYGVIIGIFYNIPVIAITLLFSCFPIFGGLVGGDEGAALGVVGIFFCLFPLIFILALMVQPLILAGTARYLQTGSLGAALNVSEIIALVRGDLGGWFVLWLLYLLCGLIGQAGGAIVIGIIFTLPYAQAVFGHLLGQKMIQMQGQQQTGYGTSYPPQQY